MNKIEHFILPEHTNKLYTNEAISSIALTKLVAEKINELVDIYNKFNDDDLAWKHEQEGRIRNGVLFMKDNLINSLHDLLELLKHEGFFEKNIEQYTHELELRLNNLITSGSVDGELLDIRTGADANIYPTAGEAIREQFNKLLTYIKSNNEYKNYLLKFETENYFGRISYFANNIFKYVDGFLYESVNEDLIKLSNNYHVVS